MDFSAIISGVASSLLAIGCVESYLALRRGLLHRALKRVMEFGKGPVLVVAPNKDSKAGNKTISYRDAYAFGHIFAICHRLGFDAQLAPSHRIPDQANEQGFISVGGPQSNDFTDRTLKRFVPGFCLRGKPNESEPRERSQIGFQFGSTLLPATETEEHAIIVKLTPDVTNQDRTIFLFFGYTGQGTGGAAYFLATYYRNIYKQFGRDAFCIGVKVYCDESYKSVSRSFVDVTKEAFQSSPSTKEARVPAHNKVGQADG